MDKKQKFFILFEKTREAAWDAVPDDIKELLYGDNGLFPNQETAIDFLFYPAIYFNNKRPIEVILEGKELEKIKKFIIQLQAGVYI